MGGRPTWPSTGLPAPCQPAEPQTARAQKRVLLAVGGGPCWTSGPLLQETRGGALKAHLGYSTPPPEFRSRASPPSCCAATCCGDRPSVLASSSCRSWDGMACEVTPIASGHYRTDPAAALPLYPPSMAAATCIAHRRREHTACCHGRDREPPRNASSSAGHTASDPQTFSRPPLPWRMGHHIGDLSTRAARLGAARARQLPWPSGSAAPAAGMAMHWSHTSSTGTTPTTSTSSRSRRRMLRGPASATGACYHRCCAILRRQLPRLHPGSLGAKKRHAMPRALPRHSNPPSYAVEKAGNAGLPDTFPLHPGPAVWPGPKSGRVVWSAFGQLCWVESASWSGKSCKSAPTTRPEWAWHHCSQV